MPFHIRLGKKSQHYNVSKESFVLPVELLDQSSIECTLSASTSGHECLADVSQRLNIKDQRYFGFLFYTKRSACQWIDLDKPVKKQLEKYADGWRLYLRVQFFIADIDMLCDDVSRLHYYLQLKTQFVEGRLKSSPEEATRLSAYSLQAEFGDYNPEMHTVEFLFPFDILPRRMTANVTERDSLLVQVLNLYRNLQNIQPGIAEIMYIAEAQQLDGYGQEGFPCKDMQTGSDVCLGVSLKGIFVVSPQQVEEFKWKDIANLIHQKKHFCLDLNEGQQKNYEMSNSDLARYTWKICVDQHKCSIPPSGSEDVSEQVSQKSILKNAFTRVNHDGIPITESFSSRPRVSFSSVHHTENIHGLPPHASSQTVQRPVAAPINIDERLPTYSNGTISGSSEPRSTSERSSLEIQNEIQQQHSSIVATQTAQQALPMTSPVLGSVANNVGGGRLSNPDQTFAAAHNNVTTVQVHHEPPYAALRPTSRDKDSSFVMSIDQALLPPYKSPPDYESFIREKYSVHNVSVNNVSFFHQNSGPMSLPAANPVYSNGLISQNAMPYYVQQQKQEYSTYENLKLSPYELRNGPPPPLPHTANNWHQQPTTATHNYHVMNGGMGGGGVPLANSFTISSPDLHSGNVHNYNRQAPLPAVLQQSQTGFNQRIPPSYYMSVPDLTGQGQQRLVNDGKRTLLVRPLSTNYSTNQATIEESPTNKFPSGSEPNLPKVGMTRYTSVMPANQMNSALNSNSRHLSIDTLNHSKHQQLQQLQQLPNRVNGHAYVSRQSSNHAVEHDSLGNVVYVENRTRPYAPTLPSYAAAAEANGMPEMSSNMSQLQQVKEENAYANIEELRATLSNTHMMEEPEVITRKDAIGAEKSEAQLAQSNRHQQAQQTPAPPPPQRDAGSAHKNVTNEVANQSKLSNGVSASNVTGDSSMNMSAANMSNMSFASVSSKDPRLTLLESKLCDPDLTAEFDLVPRMNPEAKFTSANNQENQQKNRFRDILPYEDNRVQLPPTKDNRTGYINASLIQMNYGKDMHQRYIAAQGPLASTVVDFWRMVWTCRVNVIVMVTDLTEEGQEKCHLYFPQSEDKGKNSVKFGEFQVTCNFIIESSTYVTSSLTLATGGNSMTVWHIRYTDWSDHTCPEDVQGFLSFLEGIDATYRLSGREGSTLTIERKNKKKAAQATPTKNNPPAPILVHCSAGVGRSGVVILCDALVRSLDSCKELDVPKALTQLRFQRMISVQNYEQYQFVYRVLAQYLKNSRLI